MSPPSAPPPPSFGGLWAKLEILLGLAAAGVGGLLGIWAVTRPGEVEWWFAAAGLALIVLGGYLTLAGQRSHIYRSNMESAATLAELLRASSERRSKPDEHPD
jgi:hypothetical protein